MEPKNSQFEAGKADKESANGAQSWEEASTPYRGNSRIMTVAVGKHPRGLTHMTIEGDPTSGNFTVRGHKGDHDSAARLVVENSQVTHVSSDRNTRHIATAKSVVDLAHYAAGRYGNAELGVDQVKHGSNKDRWANALGKYPRKNKEQPST